MKTAPLVIAAIAAALFSSTAFAEEPGCSCAMMKKHAPAPAAEVNTERAELDKLVAEMNGNLGPKKLEAMAAIVTRLVEQSKARTAAPAVKTPAEADAPKAEAHQH